VDPIYVNFSLSELELEQLQGAAAWNQSAPIPKTDTKVEIQLPDGRTYPYPGTLDFSGLSVDPGTGAVALRAVLPNPDHRLLPGMFVKLHLTMGEIDNGFVLPQAAVARDEKGAYVYVVGKDGKVQERRVDTVYMTRTDWIATGALKDGEQVIVSGLQKVKPGAVAKVTLETTPGGTSATP